MSRRKDQFLGGTFAYLFPVDWPKPLRITMVEVAIGTPVIATNCGSVSEVVANGQTGFVCSTVRVVEAVEKILAIQRSACREHFARHFTVRAM